MLCNMWAILGPRVRRSAQTLIPAISMLVLYGLPAGMLKAQTAQGNSQLTVPTEPSADTGRMGPPRTDFSRYTTPGMCLAAVRNLQHHADRQWIRKPSDTTLYSAGADTLSTAAVATGRRCAERFAVAQVPADELHNLFALSLWVHNDPVAHAALERQVALASTPLAKGDVLRDAVETALDGRPPRWTMIRDALTQLDALGPTAQIPQFLARNYLLAWHNRWTQIPDSVERAIATAQAYSKRLTVAELDQGMLAEASLAPYETASDAAMLANPSSVPTLFREYIAAGDKIRSILPIVKWDLNKGGTWATGMQKHFEIMYEPMLAVYGQPVPPLSGAHVFNSGGNRSWPIPGRMTLLIDELPGWRDESAYALDAYIAIRHLHALYGKKLDIVLRVETAGWTRGSLVQKPTDEIESIRRYYLDVLKLPVVLIVDEKPEDSLASDMNVLGQGGGRQTFAILRGYGPMILAGPDGTVLRYGSITASRPWYDTMERLMAGK